MTEPYDETNIADEDRLVRGVPELVMVPDGNTGAVRISSKFFSASSDPRGGLSVDVASLIEAAGLDVREFVSDRWPEAVYFLAGAAREVGLIAGYDPVAGNPYHGQVWRNPGGGRFTRGQQKALALAASRLE